MASRAKVNGTALERRVVKDATAAGIPARRQPLSGMLADFPNDVAVDNFLAECKMRAAHLDARGAKTLSLSLDWLHKVCDNAKKAGFRAGVLISRAKGSPQLYVTMKWEDWTELVAKSRNLSTITDN